VRGDASSPADLDRLVEAVRALRRSVDVLVPNAGSGGELPLPEMTPERFDAVAGLTFRGAYLTVQRMLPVLADGATIVLVSSISGSNGDAGNAVYNASKAAVRSLARTFTSDLAPRGIRVNAVSPGPTESVGFGSYISGGDPAVEAERRRAIEAAVPLGRIGRPSEVAAAVLFLASAQSSFVAGVELVVDGGMSQV
jgi:NAD(P)-dependent dehydrogenase (short-subunit alcohol dehydrogenase family)